MLEFFERGKNAHENILQHNMLVYRMKILHEDFSAHLSLLAPKQFSDEPETIGHWPTPINFDVTEWKNIKTHNGDMLVRFGKEQAGHVSHWDPPYVFIECVDLSNMVGTEHHKEAYVIGGQGQIGLVITDNMQVVSLPPEDLQNRVDLIQEISAQITKPIPS